MWPSNAAELRATQRDLAAMTPEPWTASDRPLEIAACWVCFARGVAGPGAAGDPAWSAAVVGRQGGPVERSVRRGEAGAAYLPGLVALRVGSLMEDTVRSLRVRPDVVLVDATARDHPRRAGLALHLGWVLDLPTVGVTHRPLVGRGEWPADDRGASSAIRIDDDVVARWVRTRPGTRPLVVHPGWRVDLDTAVALVLDLTAGRRTPEPLRQARHAAREARAAS